MSPAVKTNRLSFFTRPAIMALPFPRTAVASMTYSFNSKVVSRACSFSLIRVKSALEYSAETLTRDYPIPAPQVSALPGPDFSTEAPDVLPVSLSLEAEKGVRGLSWTLPKPDQNRSIPCFLRTETLSVKPHFQAGIRSETGKIESLSLARKALFLEIFPTEFQLDFWRRAVIRTRLEPREFTLLGVFGGIPAEGINLRYEAKENRLHFVPGPKKPSWKKYNEVAVFRKNSDESLLLISAGD